MTADFTPWVVPETWTWVLAGDVVDIVGGGTPRTADASNFDGGTIPWITPADLSGFTDTYIERGSRQITPNALRSSAARLLPKGSVLFSSRAPIGYVAIASNPLATNQGFKSFVLPSGLDPEYIYYYLHRAKELALALASGTTFQEISGRQAAKIPLAIASKAEQRRIVAAIDSYFTRLDDAVASLERVQRNLKRYRASVLKAAVEGRLVPTEAELARAEGRDYEPASVLLKRILAERRCRWEEAELAKMKAKGKMPKDDGWKAKYQPPAAARADELPNLPGGWCWATIDQIQLSFDQGWSPRCQRRPVGSSEEWGVIKTTAVQHMTYDESGNKALPSNLKPRPNLEVRLDDILITRAGPRVRVGVCCLVRHVSKRLMLCDKVYRLRVPKTHVSPAYLELVLNSPRMLDDIERIKSGISDSGLNLTQSKFGEFVLPIPPRAEQERIVESVAKSFTMADSVTRDSTRTRVRIDRLRQSILKWAFEGRLVDQDPTDEPASKLLERIKSERAAEPAWSPTRRPRRAMSKGNGS